MLVIQVQINEILIQKIQVNIFFLKNYLIHQVINNKLIKLAFIR